MLGPADQQADIRADTKRDGLVDLIGNSDLSGKETLTDSRDTLFLPNIGDTNRRSKQALAGPAPSNEEGEIVTML